MDHKKKKDIQCINCGVYGHTSRFCNCPTTSYGVIAYKSIRGVIKYVMIQRKDTLSYVEFIRGNYNLQNKNYIISLFQNMTVQERDFINANTFEEVWNNLWVDNRRNNMFYKSTREKFNELKNGYYIRNTSNDSTMIFSIKHIVETYPSLVAEQEWDFPKGRRKIGEKDFQCALREFGEETSIHSNEVHFIDSSKYFEEVYLSTNKTRYRNIFYVAKYSNRSQSRPLFNHRDSNQAKEVRDVQWFTSEEIFERLKHRNPEKRETFKLVHDYIVKKLEGKHTYVNVLPS